MIAETTDTALETKHAQVSEQLILLADNPELNEDQRSLARSWRRHIDSIREHATAPFSVAFLAAVGRGKSSLIAAATGLRLEGVDPQNPKDWSVLPVDDGRTTLGEIRIEFEDRSDILLVVEPMPLQALELEVRLFAQDRYAASHKTRGGTFENSNAGEELASLLQAWLTGASEDPNATLDKEALYADSVKGLEELWLARIDSKRHCERLERSFSFDREGLGALKNTLAALMNGTLPDAPVPVLSQIRIPKSRVGENIATVIDTQGLDDGPDAWLETRADIIELIEDPNVFLVICSSFEDAPDPVSMSVLKKLHEDSNTEERSQRAERLLVVDKRTKTGKPDERKKRNDRLNQCRSKLRRNDIEVADDAILCIDVREDSDGLQSGLLEMASSARQHRFNAWQTALDVALEATSTLSDQTFAARAREFDLRLWWQWDTALAESTIQPVDGLAAIARTMLNADFHWSQLHATVRRRGTYHKLPLSLNGAIRAARASCMPYMIAHAKVKAEAEKLAAQEAGMAQYLRRLVDDFSKAIVEYRKSLISECQSLLSTYFASPQSDEMWSWCEARWGQGGGYVRAVLARIGDEENRARLSFMPTESIETRLPERPKLFSLRKVHLMNFRGIEDRRYQLNDTTVFIGENGLGKTCWLEAIAAAIGTFLTGISADDQAPALVAGDVREVVAVRGDSIDPQPQLPMLIEVDGVIEGQALTWSRSIEALPIRDAGPTGDGLQIKARKAGEEIRAHFFRQLPVLAYYGTQRLWPPDTAGRTDVRNTRLEGYRDCLKAASTHEHTLGWMKKFTYAELQDGKPFAQLRAIQRAVLTCIEGAEKFFFDVKSDELVLVMKDGTRPTFRMLSDGYRNMVAMVADIAWRASVLNPHLRDKAPELAEGVVLIDEIDLHLHPKWQRRVLGNLRRAFPRLQFITTTHSPFIVQSLEPGQLVNLDERGEGIPYANQSPEDIVENHMGVKLPQRSDRRKREYEVAWQYYDLLERMPAADPLALAKLKAELDEILAPYADNQALVAFLHRQRAVAEAKRP